MPHPPIGFIGLGNMSVPMAQNRMAHDAFTPPGFALRLGIKDVDLMRRLADQSSAPLPLADLAHQHLVAAYARGRGDLDWGALITVIRELAGLEARDAAPTEDTR